MDCEMKNEVSTFNETTIRLITNTWNNLTGVLSPESGGSGLQA